MVNDLKPAAVIYAELAALLQAARGQNKYRGRQENLQKRLQIRLQIQPREGQQTEQMLVVQAEDGRAYYRAATGFVYSSQFDSLAAFLEHALAICRGGGRFIETSDSKALYK